MKGLFNLDNPVMQMLSKLCDLLILNLITLVLCLPIITAGDAITALFYMTIKMVKGEDGYIFQGYFKSFKQNFKQATIIWMGCLVMIVIFFVDYRILSQADLTGSKVLYVAVSAVAMIFVFTFVYLFPVLSRFDNTIKMTIRNSFIMSVANFGWTLLIILIDLIPFFLLYFVIQSMPFLFMFGFSGPACAASAIFVRIFKKYEPEEEEMESDTGLEVLSFIREEEEEKRRLAQEAAAAAEDVAEEIEVPAADEEQQ